MKKTKRSLHKWLLMGSVLLTTVLFFQNCGKGFTIEIPQQTEAVDSNSDLSDSDSVPNEDVGDGETPFNEEDMEPSTGFPGGTQYSCSELDRAKKECAAINSADATACRILNSTTGEELYFLGGFGPAWVIKVNCPFAVNTPEELPVNEVEDPPVLVPVATSNKCVSSSKLTCVDTQLPLVPYGRVAYRPNPDMIYAFKIVAPLAGSKFGSVNATRQVSSDSGKLIVVSETPGDISTAGKDSACVAQGTEVSHLNYITNAPSANPWIYCRMVAGRTYYFNVSSYSKWNVGTQTCVSPSTCAFYFEGR